MAAAAALAALVAPGHALGGDLPPSSAPYGLVAFNANFVPGETIAERAASYRRLHEAGVRAIRLDIGWLQVEPPGQPLHDYDFSDRDREIRAIERAGLKVVGILDYGHPDYSRLGSYVGGTPAGGGIPPFYVASAQYYPPDDPREFARYAAATARHYEHRFPGRVIGWEVWNEENEGWRFWPPHEDPAAYARLLCATHERLQGEGSDVPVLFGGVFFPAVPGGLPGMSGPDFVQAAYDSNPDLGHCFEAMAYHPYPYPFTAPELDVPVRGSVLSAYDQMHAVLARNGDGGKPLWISEVGWPTHDRAYGVSERKQAEYTARMQAASFAQGLPVLTWYTYGDYSDPSGANQEAWFGFFRPDGSAKPSYRALKTFAHVFRGSDFARDLSAGLGLPEGGLLTGGRGFALRYKRPGFRRGKSVATTGITRCPPARITALWLASESAAEAQGGLPDGGTFTPQRRTVTLPVRAPQVTVVDYLGKRRFVEARRDAVTLEIGSAPIYVIDQGPCSATIA